MTASNRPVVEFESRETLRIIIVCKQGLGILLLRFSIAYLALFEIASISY